ncbi:MAG: TonB-dependent receptor [Candidatus Cloacimonetes bacterium]|nr:TonB-dependent receptor [Candidatus Cloacimonadota bacterium]
MVSANLSYTDFQYATIIPTEYLGTANNHQPAKIPAYSLLDFKAQYQIKINNKYRVTLSASAHNILNEKFVVRAYDTPLHSLDNTQVILGHGRCFSASMALGF